jgi:hypothetical protein
VRTIRPGRGAALFALRAFAGAGGSILAGLLVDLALPGFGRGMLDPSGPAFQCVSVGLPAAVVVALVRGRMPGPALGLSALVAVPVSAGHWDAGAAAAVAGALAGLAVGAGIFLTAALYDGLARHGFQVGKFLVLGPLLGGAYLAATPLSGLAGGSGIELLQAFWLNAIVGLAVGDGVGFGVEMAELLASSIGPEETGPAPPGPAARIPYIARGG